MTSGSSAAWRDAAHMLGMENNTSRVPAGVPTGGQFASHDRADGDVNLRQWTPAPEHDRLQALVKSLYASTSCLDTQFTWGDLVEAAQKEDSPMFAAGVAARAAIEGFRTPLPRTIVRYACGNLIDATQKQNLAADHVDDRLTEWSGVGHYSRADYADVTPDGIAYGFTVAPQVLAIVSGVEPEADESIDDYVERVQEANPDYYKRLGDILEAEYGCRFLDDGSDFDTFEFFVEYPADGGPDNDGGAAAVTIEWMGDHAEATTKLLAFKNDLEYGTRMQSVIAKGLGMRWELSTNPDRRFGDGRWVKDE